MANWITELTRITDDDEDEDDEDDCCDGGGVDEADDGAELLSSWLSLR